MRTSVRDRAGVVTVYKAVREGTAEVTVEWVPQQGTVVAAGPGKKDEPMEVKVGDVVIYGKYAGTEVSVEGKDYLIMKQSDILAIL